MQRVLLFSKWLPTCLCISLFLCILACNQSKQNESENPVEPYGKPIPIQVNTKEGYRINPIFNDTIKEIVNSYGDTVITGRPYAIRGKVIPAEKLEPPITVPAGKPIVREAYSNLYPVPGNLKVIPVDENQLQQFVYGRDSVNFILKNSSGELVPTGTPIPVIEKKVVCRFPPLVKAQPLSNRYDAISNIKLLDVDQGLLFSNIPALLEDANGNLWISQYGGSVSQYDGNTFRHFGYQNGFPERFHTAMLMDKSGNLWIGTRTGGVARYDGTHITTFTEKNGLTSNAINCFAEDKNGNIWIGTNGNGVSCYTPPKDNQPGTFTNYAVKEGISGMYISSILEDKNGNIWFGSGAFGITLFEHISNGHPGKVTYLNQKTGLNSDNIQDIFEDKAGNIWIATNSGVCRYDLPRDDRPGRITQYTFGPAVPNITFETIHEDQNGNIWFGTIGAGVIKLLHKGNERYENEMFVHITREEGLPHNTVTSVIEDKRGNIWLGTGGGGVACIKARAISHLNKKEGFTESAINSIYEDRNDNLWFGTVGDGLIMYKRAKDGRPGTYHHYTTAQGLPGNIITCVKGDKHGNLWLGIEDYGICLFDGKSFTTYTVKSGLSGKDVYQLLIDRKGNIWTGTYTKGFTFLAPGNSKENRKPVFIHYTEKEGLLDDNVQALHEDYKGDIWLGSNEGVSRLQIPSNGHEEMIMHFTKKEGLPSKFVNILFEDQANNMWFGTSGGMVCYTSSTDTFPGTFTFHGAIQRTNNIRAIGQDHLGNIWFSTINGMGMIIRSQDSVRLNQRIILSKLDGLKGKMFMGNSVLFDRHHYSWWGNSYGGIEVLDMDNIALSAVELQPKLNGLEINENFMDFRNIPDSLQKGIEYDSVPDFENYPVGLNLAYTNKNLAFHFSAVDWAAPDKVKYSFRMNGLNENWSPISNKTDVEYRSLPYGDYIFEIKAFGESQKWSESFKYPFRIRPPWWYSWWAYVMYGLVGCTVVYSTYQFQLSRKLALAEKKRLVELDRVKNRLYTNITHEFRTPLTLIHGPVSQALTYKTGLEQKDIQSIYRQSERLQQLINQMLELQKLESGKLKAEYEYGEIVQIIRYLFSSFEPWAREKNISLIFNSNLQEVHMDLDQEKLTQIITNLVSNAIKHTPRSGKVALSLSISHVGNHLLIHVQDTGTGISAEDLPYIFDQFYQSKRAATGGTGIGLALARNLSELLGGTLSVESTLDLGSTFTLSLPITKHAQKPIQALPEKAIVIQEEQDEDVLFPATDEQQQGKPIILIVEDHPEIAQYVASCLTSEYQILTAFNGNDGIRMAYEHIPDLIVSDVMMPGKDGFELTSILKTDIQTSHIPIILLTGRGDHDALLTGIEHGADAYVTKPFDPTELKLRVRKLLELRANLSQYYRSHAHAAEPDSHVQASARENEFMRKIRIIIEEHINDSQFNMNMLSKYMAMSHPQLHRKITALTGESVGKFVRSVRLTKAKELLRNSELTISEIAYETGFSEPGYFSKIFSKEYNMTPSEFRGGLN